MFMTPNDSTQQDEIQRAFVRYLPKRIAAFKQRVQRYRTEGWESGGMVVLSGDLQRLADASARYDLIEPRQQLLMLAQMVDGHIATASPPDTWQCEGMLALLSAVTHSLVASLRPASTSAASDTTNAPLGGQVPPDAPGAQAMPSTAAGPIPPVADVPCEVAVRRIYHLSDGNPFALELWQVLESEGYEIESVATLDELSELLMCMLPHVLLVDASHMTDLTDIEAVRRDMQQRSQPPQRILMVVMAVQDNLESRRSAHCAGVDLLLFPPFDTADVVHRLQALLTPETQAIERVLIVEDDRGAAFFAQSVLTHAGMQTLVEYDPLHVLESLDSFRPDLVLMDLHMPHVNGVEVTMMIRDQPAFARLPIVFLSGESDPDSRLEAINAGGDEFLFKPIRPKQLIAAVQDCVVHTKFPDERGPALGSSKANARS